MADFVMGCVQAGYRIPDLFQRNIPEVLRRSADKHPEKHAFVQAQHRLTYADLVDKSLKLATVLQDLGIRKGDRVGIFLRKSPESAIAIYGIMSAGAVFVPIDPMTPPHRMRHIVSRCDITVLVTHEPQRGAFTEYLETSGHTLATIGLEYDEASETSLSWEDVYQSPARPPCRLTGQDLAYIMWTSGSTGEPKGMTHTHGNGLIYAGMLTETHELNEDDRFLGLSPLHFDMCVMDYVAAPLVGGTTIIVPEAVATLPAALTRLAAEERATIWYSVPFSMTQVLEHGGMEQHDLSALRWMIYGGENFSIKHLRALMEKLPNAQFANAYGPAETHQVSSFTVGEIAEDAGPVSIGKPWRTLEVLVLDDNDQPVAAGEQGELVVRSPSCMRGYWRDQKRTREAFYSRPVSEDMNDLFYRTGDIVMQESNGLMHFLGRKGRQVKVRGYRVELDEVEATVLSGDGVEECAVIRSADGTQLQAFVRSGDGKTVAVADLAAHCRSILPVYAVPSTFEFVTEFPRTGSGKIDRSKLPAAPQSKQAV